MDSITSAQPCQAFSNTPLLVEGVLPLLDVQKLGPASRTLAALIDIADQDRQSTFKSLARIAVIAGLSVSTVARHLVILGAEGYITKLGRQKPAGRRMARRTVTYRLIAPVQDLLDQPYLPLPKSARHLPWSQAATFAYMTRWAGKGALLSTSARAVSRQINISIRAVKNAMRALESAGLISRGPAPTFWVVGGKNDRGGGADLTVAVNLSFSEPNLEKPSSQQEHTKEATPLSVVQVVSAKSSSTPSLTPPQGPSWLNIKPDDLDTPESRRVLFHDATRLGVIQDTHEERLYFQACCIASRGKQNPGGHLRAMVENRWNPPKPIKPVPAARQGKTHTLGHVDRQDLVDPAAAVALVESRLGPQGQYGRLRITAEAKHALRVGKNAGALFAANVGQKRYYATEADEDLAMAHLRKHRPRIPVEPTSAALADLLRPPD